ncbi:MAG: 5-formyltetrahydrofolate cyclo-ligase [Cyclobacteriaceae bacterium]
MLAKAELRKQFLQKRKALSLSESALFNSSIADYFKDLFGKKPTSNVHIFLPIQKHHEINTWPIIRFLWKSDVKVIVSSADFENINLKHFILSESTKLIENKWGIPEPINADPFPIPKIEMVLVPLLAFDAEGYRVGYGKGFYDKFLEACNPSTVKVGLSFFELVDQIKVDSHDVKLDFCITPKKIYQFNE